MIEDWAKLLLTYGPGAVLLLFVFVIEKKARGALGDNGIPRLLSVPIYILTWLVTFSLCYAVVWFWYITTFPQEVAIRGAIEGLRDDETVFCESATFYLSRSYSPGRNQYGYSWRLVTEKRIPDGTVYSLYLKKRARSRPDDASGEIYSANRYEITIHPVFYNGEVRIVYEPKTENLIVLYGGKREALAPAGEIAAAGNSYEFAFLPTVHAQPSPQFQEILRRLQSDDPIIRRDARLELAGEGQVALPEIEKTLQDPRSPYRIRLGLLSALNSMQSATVSPTTRTAIEASARDDDPALRAEAERFLFRLPAPTCGVNCGVERWSVKSLADPDASKVDLATRSTTIDSLTNLTPPSIRPAAGRVGPVELQTYELKVLLLGYKLESDRDIHIVIADPSNTGKTMVAEIPDSVCTRVCESRQFEQIKTVRATFVGRLGEPAKAFRRLEPPLPIVITGVGFFDVYHAQTGMARNGIELHPVLNMVFSTLKGGT